MVKKRSGEKGTGKKGVSKKRVSKKNAGKKYRTGKQTAAKSREAKVRTLGRRRKSPAKKRFKQGAPGTPVETAQISQVVQQPAAGAGAGPEVAGPAGVGPAGVGPKGKPEDSKRVESVVPRVVLVGRPNVGKSTLFNRILGRRQAIEGKTPYLTRDRNEAFVTWDNLRFMLVDVAGMFPENPTQLTGEVDFQIGKALEEADLALVLVDVVEGLSPFDAAVMEQVRHYEKPVLLVVNKVDNQTRFNEIYQFTSLGLEKVHPVSAIHGRGIGELMENVVAAIMSLTGAKPDADMGEDEPLRIAVVGRPNVGKSTFINSLLGEERVIAHDMPYTTRDTVEVPLVRKGQSIILIDTAGMRRRAKVAEEVEKLSVHRTVKAIKSSQISILLVDATTGVTTQDKKIAALINRQQSACVLGVNKWDLVEESPRPVNVPGFIRAVRKELGFLDEVPFFFISAKTGNNLGKLIKHALFLYDRLKFKVGTPDLNRIVQDITARHLPPAIARGHRLKFYYGTQVGIMPPRFIFFVNRADYLTPTYKRYFTVVLKERLGLEGIPIRIVYRSRGNAK